MILADFGIIQQFSGEHVDVSEADKAVSRELLARGIGRLLIGYERHVVPNPATKLQVLHLARTAMLLPGLYIGLQVQAEGLPGDQATPLENLQVTVGRGWRRHHNNHYELIDPETRHEYYHDGNNAVVRTDHAFLDGVPLPEHIAQPDPIARIEEQSRTHAFARAHGFGSQAVAPVEVGAVFELIQNSGLPRIARPE